MPRKNKPSGSVARLARRIVLGVTIAGLIAGAVLLIVRPTLPRQPLLPTLTFDADSYVGSQLIGIVNSHLRPEFAFESISYEPPGTARLAGISLTAPGGVKIVEAQSMVITLAETPRKDRPIKIERIMLAGGVIRFVGDKKGGFVGFSRMTKGRKDADISKEFRLSNVLVLRRIELDDISIEYRADANADAMQLDHITLAMDVHPGREAGWYAIEFESGRSPGFELDIAGRLNLDTFDAEIAAFTAAIDAGADTIGTLPGPLASLLDRYEVRGRLGASGKARFNLMRPLQGEADLAVRGERLHLAVGDYQVPVESLRIDAAFSEGVLSVEPLEADLLEGTLQANGRIESSSAGRPVHGVCVLSEINLRKALRRTPAHSPPKLAGTLSGRVEAQTLLASPRASLSGTGAVAVADGRLLLLPGLTQLSELIGRDKPEEAGTLNHRGSASFTLGPTGITITESEIITNTIAARGTGLVGFDRSLDLRINAGPLEKIQSMLGKVGDLIGKVTDRLVKYTIKGTIDQPVVGVAPLGIDRDKP